MTHMVDVRIDIKNMYDWAKKIGILGSDDGYIVHSLVCAAYGSKRPQPFRIYPDMAAGQVRLLGYATSSADELAAERISVAEPLVSNAFVSEVSKEMPSNWSAGSRFTFNLLVSPVVTSRTTGKEVDAFVTDVTGSDRSTVYKNWLQKRLSGRADLEYFSLKSFKIVKVARRSTPDANGKRRLGSSFHVPSAEIDGVLTVKDPALFTELFKHSIGKHGAFGFGALMLRPSK